ncbi:hypothetical protein [Methylomonas koyamae]|uniref:hypothetical protein n=1 Tax=Methylomonas koyamae TaxID=702114 RepID=UPI000AABC573|nr:hypothetical protein [Methylomonas koyamae]
MLQNTKSDYQIAQQQILDGIISGQFEIENRNDLGPLIPIRLFQALRMVALGSNVEDILGQGAPSLVYHSGQSLGLAMGQIAVATSIKIWRPMSARSKCCAGN